ncbi:MAG: ISKra4 family transposase [Desulfomonilaceae bacterium]
MERPISDVASLVNEILAFVRGPAQAMEIRDVERHLLSLVMAVGRAALEEFVAEKGSGYAGKEIIDAEGNRCPYVRDRSCAYRSIFGAVLIPRAYYHAAGSPGAFPLDGELNLPERGYSYLVQEFSSRLAVKMSYEDALEILCSFFPLKMPIRSLESIVRDVCDEVERFYEEKAPLDVCPEAVVTVATVDKKGIVIRKPQGGEAGPEAPPSNPDKPGKKKMATVISTYVTPRHVRTAGCILKEVSDQGGPDSRPKPQNKRTWGSLTDDPEKTVARLKKAVDQRLPEGNELVCILDGEKYLWSLVYKYFPTAFFVLDIFHVLEHLGKAALCFHDEGSAQARQFVTERLRMLLNGRAGRVIGGLKQMLTKQDLSGTKRRCLEQVIGYLERNRKNMRYEICLAKGYPIGSGVIEGACRHLINDRLELTGMSWTLRGAESMMRLRAVHINKDWDEFWTYRRQKERLRLYGIQDSSSAGIRDLELPRAA